MPVLEMIDMTRHDPLAEGYIKTGITLSCVVSGRLEYEIYARGKERLVWDPKNRKVIASYEVKREVAYFK